MFAVEAMDPRIGRVEVTQTFWGTSVGKTGIKRQIELVNCEELLPGGLHEDKLNNKNFDLLGLQKLKKKFGFLCPIDFDDMSV